MFVIIILLSIMGLIGTDIFVPSLPNIAQHFQQSQNHVQLLISLFLAGFAISQLFYGPISDRVGRKWPLLIGLIIFTLSSMLCINADSFIWLCMGRILQGMGVGAGLSLSRAILRDLYQGMTLAIKTSQMAVFISLTPAVAPFLGGLLQQFFGFRGSFVFMFFYGILVLTLLLTGFKETIQQKDQTLTLTSTIRNYKTLLKDSYFMCYAFIAGLTFSAIILYANVLPFIIQEQLKLSALVNGLTLLFAASGISFGAYFSSKYVKRISSEGLVNLGLIIFTISGFLLAFIQCLFGENLICLIPLIFLVTFACGIIFPNTLALSFSEIKFNIGIAGAIYGTTQTFISMLMNFLLSTIKHQDQIVLGLFYLVIGILGFSLLNYFQRKSINNDAVV